MTNFNVFKYDKMLGKDSDILVDKQTSYPFSIRLLLYYTLTAEMIQFALK